MAAAGALRFCNPWPDICENAPASKGYKDGFATQLMLKDLGLAVEAAGQVKQPVVLGGLVQQLYQQLCMQGNANLDFQALFSSIFQNKHNHLASGWQRNQNTRVMNNNKTRLR